MRSKVAYPISEAEVYLHAQTWLDSLDLAFGGTKCTYTMMIRILLFAASRTISIAAAVRDLSEAPSNQACYDALNACIGEVRSLQNRINQGLVTHLSRSFKRKARPMAIDLTLIPYHGKPHQDAKEIYRSQPKSGTTHFHAYATVIVIEQGYRYTLAMTPVEYGERLKSVLIRLLNRVRELGVKVKYLTLDKEFYTVEILSFLQEHSYRFIVPIILRGRKPKVIRPESLRALLKVENSFYWREIQGTCDNQSKTLRIRVCVASKDHQDSKTNKRCRKKLLFAVSRMPLNWRTIREKYRKRFGIETSYRQMHEAKIRTSTRDPKRRLLFIAVALILRNVWVWLHLQMATRKSNGTIEVSLELLRFEQMLWWITRIVDQQLNPISTYECLT